MSDEQNQDQTPDQASEVNASQEVKTDKPAADLNISDLVAIKNIIEIASTRGAFKPAEFEVVGKTFNKLSTFLDAVANQQKESQ